MIRAKVSKESDQLWKMGYGFFGWHKETEVHSGKVEKGFIWLAWLREARTS